MRWGQGRIADDERGKGAQGPKEAGGSKGFAVNLSRSRIDGSIQKSDTRCNLDGRDRAQAVPTLALKSKIMHEAQGAYAIRLSECAHLLQHPPVNNQYALVSTLAADLANRLAKLKAAGCEKVLREKFNCMTSGRWETQNLVPVVDPASVDVIAMVDRNSCDTKYLRVIALSMQLAGASLRSLAEPALDTKYDCAELLLPLLSVAAKLERRRIKERTVKERAIAKGFGSKFGRKQSLVAHQLPQAPKRVAAMETQRCFAYRYNVRHMTISRLAP
jgi:DNA invertase Pin-like site-specific DNA recombinase